jgi:hypothetical protein
VRYSTELTGAWLQENNLVTSSPGHVQALDSTQHMDVLRAVGRGVVNRSDWNISQLLKPLIRVAENLPLLLFAARR